MIKNLRSIVSYVPKQILSVLLVAGLLMVPVMSLMAQSSGRPTMPYNGPGTPGADHVVFNSFTGVPNIGDERDFFHGKIAGASGGFTDPVNVEDGQEVLMRVYVHNNADKSLNESGQGVATNTKVRVDLADGISNSLESTAYISADNAQPKQISDEITLNSASKVGINYVPGSATIKTNFMDKAISDDIVKGGVLIGDDKLDGKVNGCFEYVALVTFKVKVNKPKLDVDKQVRKAGVGTFEDTLKGIKPGDDLEYRIKFKNTGTTDLTDVTVGDNLPPYVTYVNDSAVIYNNNTGPEGRNIGNNLTKGGTIIKETYKPGALGTIVFKAHVAEVAAEERCNVFKLTNVAIAVAPNTPQVEDKAVTEVDSGRECEEEKNPEFACEMLTKEKVSKFEYKFTTDTTAKNGATVKSYTYNFGDGSDELVTDQNTVNHTYAEDGEYTTTVDVTFDVNGENKTVTSDDCKVHVSIDTPETPEEPEEEGPKVLANTGPGETLAALFGTTGLGQGVRVWLSSRRKFTSVLLNK